MSTWRDNLRTIEPYVPGEQPNLPDMVKLNTNENPYPPSPKVVKTLKNFDCDSLRLYPDPNSQVLADALAKCYGLQSDQVFLGVGSDDVLAIAFMTFSIRKSQSCFRILHIPSMMSGQSCFRFHMRDRLWMTTLI